MIRHVTVSGFKGIQEAMIDFPTLTIFIGENGTGKSSIIHALSILKRSKGTNVPVTDLSYANLGLISDLVAPGGQAAIEISGQEGRRGFGLDPDIFGGYGVSYTCKIACDVQGLSSYSTYIECGRFKVSNRWTRYEAENAPASPASWVIEEITFNLTTTSVIGRAFGLSGYSIPGPASTDAVQRQRQYRAQAIYRSLESISLVIDNDLEQFFVVPPLRGLTEASYGLPQSPSQEIQFRQPNSQMQLAGNLKYWEANAKKISRSLSELLGVELQIKLDPGPIVRIVNARNGVNFVNEGFGANQLLFVFERIMNSPEQSLVAIEEPETHLHPKAQFALGRLLSETAVDERRRLILLTHSPHLLSGILTAIKSKKIQPEDVALYFFEKRKDMTIQVSRAKIDEQGVVTDGLRAFMEAAVSELLEYSTAGR